MKHYRGPQVCKIAHVTYRRLDYWARVGFLRPSVMDANGSGTQRLYSYRDIEVACALARLSARGIQVGSDFSALVAAHVREHGLHGHASDGFLAVDLDALNDPRLVSA